MHSAAPHLEKMQYLADRDALKVTWFHKMMTMCLNLNVAKASQSQKMCEAISDVCLYLSHLATPAPVK
jgi:hypothetical protein